MRLITARNKALRDEQTDDRFFNDEMDTFKIGDGDFELKRDDKDAIGWDLRIFVDTLNIIMTVCVVNC